MKKWMVDRILFLALTLMVLCSITYDSFSCSCIGKSTLKEDIVKADVIFSGRILSENIFSIIDSSLPSGFTMRKKDYLVEVIKFYKRHEFRDTLHVITNLGHGDCGYPFQINKKYIIYAEYSEHYFERGSIVSKFIYTDICMRTMRINRKEIKLLRKWFKHTLV